AVAAMAGAVAATAAVEAAVDAATAAAANGAADKPAHLRGKRFCRPGPLSGPQFHALTRVRIADRYWRGQRTRLTDEILAQSLEAGAAFDLPARLATRGTLHSPITACAAPCQDRPSQVCRTPGALCLLERTLRQN